MTNIKMIKNLCEKMANADGYYDEEIARMIILFVMDMSGYQMIPLDPVNDPDGNEQGCRWEKRNHKIGETLADILEYFQSQPDRYKQNMIREIRKYNYPSIEAVYYDLVYDATVI